MMRTDQHVGPERLIDNLERLTRSVESRDLTLDQLDRLVHSVRRLEAHALRQVEQHERAIELIEAAIARATQLGSRIAAAHERAADR